MTYQKSLLRVFLSSPGDLGPQRDIARQTIASLNTDPLVAPRFIVEVVGWDTPGARVPLGAHETPQASVNTYLPLPRDCELTIVLLWSRLGTPLPPDWGNGDGRLCPSGTVWELEDARKAQRPVWVYRRTLSPMFAIDDPDWADKRAQLEAVKTFVAQVRSPDGSLRFGLHEFEDDEQLRALLTEHLRHFVGRLLHAVAKPAGQTNAAVAAVAAVTAVAAPPTAPQAVVPILRELSTYPMGPMIKDIRIDALSFAIAEAFDSDHVKAVFAGINDALAEVAERNTPSIRLARGMFATSLGSKYFWADVLFWAAMQGPRVMAATISIVDPHRLDGSAQSEYYKIVERLNRYV